jgi:NTP pyrophosphatase (non-canonical NTP hydrolase)
MTDELSLNEYQDLALDTMFVGAEWQDDVNHFAFGLAAEVGEISTLLQKFYRGDSKYNNFGEYTPYVTESMRKELGDVLWHVAALAETFGWSLEEIATENVEKLQKRKAAGVLKGDGDDR